MAAVYSKARNKFERITIACFTLLFLNDLFLSAQFLRKHLSLGCRLKKIVLGWSCPRLSTIRVDK